LIGIFPQGTAGKTSLKQNPYLIPYQVIAKGSGLDIFSLIERLK
jgi:hypothetical protein